MADATILIESAAVGVADQTVEVDLVGGEGPSVYQTWLAAGHTGTLDDFFNDMIVRAGLTVTGASGQSVSSRALLAAIASPVDKQTAFLAEAGREGVFKFSTANHSSDVTADPGQGVYIATSSDTTGASGAWVRFYVGGPRISWFGAVGDGATDNTTAIQRALDFAITLKVTELVVPKADNVHIYTKVTVPLVGYDPVGGMQTLRIRGEAPPSTWFGTLPLAGFHLSNSGSILKTTSTGGAGIKVTQGSHSGYDFNWLRLDVKDLQLRTYNDPNITALDATWAQQFTTDNVIFDTGIWPTNSSEPSHSTAYGIITPGRGNGAFTRLKDTIVCGYYYGIKANEHTFFDYVTVNCCKFGVQFVAADHASYATRLAIYRCQTGLTFDGAHYFDCAQLDVEHAGVASTSGPDNWQIPVRDIADAGNLGRGTINWFAVLGNVAGPDPSFTWNGGAYLQIRQVGEKTISRSLFANTNSFNFPISGTAANITFTQVAAEVAVINGADTTQILLTTSGTFELIYDAAWVANTTGYRRLRLLQNGTSIAKAFAVPISGEDTYVHLHKASFTGAAGDVIKVEGFQNSGGALAFQTPAGDFGVLVIRKLRS